MQITRDIITPSHLFALGLFSIYLQQLLIAKHFSSQNNFARLARQEHFVQDNK